MTTAAEVITKALHLFGILDQTEEAQSGDIATGVPILNDLLRAEHVDGAVQFLIKRVVATIPAGVAGTPYSFTVKPSGDVPVDAVAVRAIYVNDISANVNRETRIAPIADVVRTTYPGIITKWHPERQVDGSILITAWQPPRQASKILMEYGARMSLLVDGDSTVDLPPEGIHDAALLFGRRVCSSYGRSFEAVGPVAADALAADLRWRNWARGQQWLRFIRS